MDMVAKGGDAEFGVFVGFVDLEKVYGDIESQVSAWLYMGEVEDSDVIGGGRADGGRK